MKSVKENNVTVVVLIVILTMIIGVSLSYAFFSARISGTESESTIVMEAGSLSIEYTDLSNVISVSKVYPREEAWVTKEFKVTGTNTTNLVLFYKIKIVLDNNEFEGLGLSYSLESENTGNNGNIIPSISKEYIGKDNINLGQGYFINTGTTPKEHKYTLKIYLKENGEDQNYLQGAKFAAHIEIESGDKAVEVSPKGWDEAGSGTLLAGIKANYPTIKQPLTTPGKEISAKNEAILAGTVDDYGMSYYFRGSITNNYVQFANKCWRIVRITGDGSIKLVLYNDNIDMASNPCGIKGGNLAFANYDGTNFMSVFNEQEDDNAYVGFMYGTPGSSTYAETHANTNKSTILQNLETWYKNNLATYESKLADTIWCNDKSTLADEKIISTRLNTESNTLQKNITLYPGYGYGNNNTMYSGSKRNSEHYSFTPINNMQFSANGTGPTFICPDDNNGGKLSKFTVNDTNNGNGNLNYKIGLLTVDEILFAGSINEKVFYAHNYYTFALKSYIKENATMYLYWTMTPDVAYGFSHVISAGQNKGTINTSSVASSIGLRPSISLISNVTISGGNGTSSNPFVIN